MAGVEVAEVAITIFRVAFERWVAEGEDQDLPTLVDDSFAQLRLAR